MGENVISVVNSNLGSDLSHNKGAFSSLEGALPPVEVDPFIIRDFSPGDLAFIMSSWLRELHMEYQGPLPDTMWFDTHRAFVEKIFSDKRVVVKVLAAADRPSEIIGYAVAIPNEVLIWIHVRKPFRARQLGLRLLDTVQGRQANLLFQSQSARLRLRNKSKGRALRLLFR